MGGKLIYFELICFQISDDNVLVNSTVSFTCPFWMEVFFGNLTPCHLHSALSAFLKKERGNCSTCLTHVPLEKKIALCVLHAKTLFEIELY
jgi:hypothetical protein